MTDFPTPAGTLDGEAVAKTAARILTAIRTLRALPDPEGAVLLTSSYWPDIIRMSEEAYAYNEARPPKHTPTNAEVDDMLPAMELLLKFKHADANGDRDYKIIWARAYGVPWWKIGQRHGRSEMQLRRWMDGAMAAIHAISCGNKKRT